MKNSEGLACRYHHMYRLKKVRAKYYYWDSGFQPSSKQLGKYYHTPALCSCYMCGNPRKYEHAITIQEIKFLEQFEYDLLELDITD